MIQKRGKTIKVMKIQKTRNILILVLMLILLSGCAHQEDRKRFDENDLRFTFVCPIVKDDIYWNAAFKGMQDAADELQNVDVRIVGPEDGNKENFLQAFDAAVAAQVDAILISGLESSVADRIDAAAEQGIPVALIDTDLPDSQRVCYVGLDNKQVGKEGAELIAGLTGEKANIAVIGLTDRAENFVARKQGMYSVWNPLPDMHVVVERTASNMVKAYQAAWDILEEYPEVDTFFCIDATTPVGVSQALRDRGLEGEIVCVGLGSDKEIIRCISDGSLDGTICLKPYEMGYQAVKNLALYLQGQRIETYIIPEIIAVTASNVEEFAKNEGYNENWLIKK